MSRANYQGLYYENTMKKPIILYEKLKAAKE